MSEFLYSQYSLIQSEAAERKEKSEQFLQRIAPFKDVKSLESAKELAQKILPSKEGLTSFYVGNIKCIIVNKKEFLRITVDTPEKLISYDFR